MYHYGLIGNCQASALLDREGTLVWMCLPRPDSPPVFGQLLDESGGHFKIQVEGACKYHQHYLPNTNVLVTRIESEDGCEVKITDFCPRFEQHGRMYRPPSVFRIVEAVRGTPLVKVSNRPVIGWEKELATPVRGNSHLRYDVRGDSLRVTTNAPLTYLTEETSFILNEKLYFAITWGAGVEADLAAVTQQFLEQTIQYWRVWVKHCTIPTLFQKETIRSALTLKLHCFEDTGAILAALTTSLPEEAESRRNWDYRFCWLRDAAFVLAALHQLGHFEEMEGFLRFLLNIGHRYEHSREGLGPVYALDQQLPLPETEHEGWRGFGGSRPVRSNNQAAEHVQNDVYGEMVLTLAPIFFDERFQHLRTPEHEALLQNLIESCVRSISRSDAGLWELRNGWQEHSFSNLMCWAGIDRAVKLKERGFLAGLDLETLRQAKRRAELAIENSTREGSVRNGPKDDSYDAALLLLPVLGFPEKDLCAQTVR
ncbi:MAG: hypothetical protein C5B49_04105, partial [Bdellovibrio sp.]